MKQLVSGVIAIIVLIFYFIFVFNAVFPTYETNAEKSDSIFGVMFIGLAVFSFSYIMFKWILNQFSRFKIFHWVGCYLPNPNKNFEHSCRYCDRKYRSRWGRKFGGFGQRWEQVYPDPDDVIVSYNPETGWEHTIKNNK